MDKLPDEVVLQILSHLTSQENVSVQLVSRRIFSLARDNNLWKRRCFDESRSEITRRHRERLASQDPRLLALWRAAHHISSTFPASQHHIPPEPTSLTSAMASWDPAYPAEKVDFYRDYIHRHAPESIAWMEAPKDATGRQELDNLGVGALYNGDGVATKVVAPLEDGSVCVWDIDLSSLTRGRIAARTPGKFLPVSAASIETGAVENVSIDNDLHRCYIATGDCLSEIDLHTLQVVKQQHFPFPLTVLSEAKHPLPLTVGTLNTLHLYDTRVNSNATKVESSVKCELIGGSILSNDPYLGRKVPKAQSSLPQPRPLSILHLPEGEGNDVWVGGRFKSLLHYDRRFWPRIKDTLFTGARISSLSCLPYPYIPRELDLLKHPDIHVSEYSAAKSRTGHTIIAGGEYNGKGSLELYGLSANEQTCYAKYANRQTASISRVLSVCPHGTTIVFSDGDGNLKWVERDGSTLVRQLDMEESKKLLPSNPHRPITAENSENIVQKILPINKDSAGRADEAGLLINTGDGRLGMIGFGRDISFAGNGSADKSIGESEEETQERLYDERMRDALERHADETRFVRGLGAAMLSSL